MPEILDQVELVQGMKLEAVFKRSIYGVFRRQHESSPNSEFTESTTNRYSRNPLTFVLASLSVVYLLIGMFNISTIVNGHNNKLKCWPFHGVSKLPKNLSIVLVCLLLTPEIPGFVFNLIFVLVCDFKLWLDKEI